MKLIAALKRILADQSVSFEDLVEMLDKKTTFDFEVAVSPNTFDDGDKWIYLYVDIEGDDDIRYEVDKAIKGKEIEGIWEIKTDQDNLVIIPHIGTDTQTMSKKEADTLIKDVNAFLHEVFNEVSSKGVSPFKLK